MADVINYIPNDRRTIINYGLGLSEDWGKTERVTDEKRETKFDEFLKNNLSFTRKCENWGDFEKIGSEYDVFVAGSDQIWTPAVFDPRYYFDYVKDNRKKVSYAPSMGPSAVENEYTRMELRKLLLQFTRLSVREQQGADLIYELTGRKAEVVIDPTLLLEYAEWRKIIPTAKKTGAKQKYILCYFLGENEQAWKHVQKISEQTKLPVKILPIFAKDAQYGELQMGVGPEEYFNLIDDAEIVLTDSFHGVVFSIICSKPFYVFERFESQDKLSQNARIYNFLDLVKLRNRLIGYRAEVKNEYSFEMDWKKTQEIIAAEKKRSWQFLENALEIKDPLVSIIVPAYNVEKYIGQCLDSISKQTYKNLEIIVVDDGSPDKSGEIAEAGAKKDQRIKVIHQKNEGLSAARNSGYNIANGEYIVFVDSDDALAPDYVEYMLRLIESTKTDIAISVNHFDHYQKEQVIEDKFEIVSADVVLERIQYDANQQVWNKIYKKSYLDKYQIRHFPEILFGEGNTFNTYVLEHADSVGVGRRKVYYYRNNLDSSTRKFAWGKRHQTIDLALECRNKVISKKNLSLRRAFRYHIWKTAFYVYRGILSLENSQEHLDDLKKYRRLLRTTILGPLLADQTFISKDYKKWAVKVFISPKTEAEKMNREEHERHLREEREAKKNQTSDGEIMPWETDQSNQRKENASLLEMENERLESELLFFGSEIAFRNSVINQLNDELRSHFSIIRSAKLLLGNIKRRVLNGKKREF